MDFTVDTRELTQFLNKFKQKALPEVNKAVKETVIYGFRTLMTATPKLTAATSKRWSYKMNDLKSGVISNNSIVGKYNLIDILDTGHGLIKPLKPNGVLVFRLTRQGGAAKKMLKTGRELLNERKDFMKTLKGKGLNQYQKNLKAIAKTGIVVAKQSRATTGKNFMLPSVQKIEYKLQDELSRAMERLVA